MRNKIGWCDLTWNPVWGCKNKCEYCYARKMAGFRYNAMADKEYKYLYYKVENFCKGEFANRLRHFVPTFIQSNFDKRFPKKPQRIFVGSMSEIHYWKKEWVEKVLEKVKLYSQHIFQFLTKYPEVYSKWDFPENCWLGITITKNDDFDNGTYDFIRSDLNHDNIKYISFEPLFGNILSYKLLKYFDWVIIGAETGNRGGKAIPKLEWITDIVEHCRNKKIPVYLKDSIIKLYPDLAFEYPNFHKFPGFYDKKEMK